MDYTVHMNTLMADLLTSRDYTRYGAAVLVRVDWLLQNVTSSCDFGDMNDDRWEEMMEFKAADTGFGHLVDSMMQRGHLKEGAIGISLSTPFFGSPFEAEDLCITEGHHRLVAAMLLGFDHVWISCWGKEWNTVGDHYSREILAHENEEDPYPIHLCA